LEIKANSPDKITIEPKILYLGAFESFQVKIKLNLKDLGRYVEKKDKVVLKESLLIKSDFFL
jgi:hypothetical protein